MIMQYAAKADHGTEYSRADVCCLLAINCHRAQRFQLTMSRVLISSATHSSLFLVVSLTHLSNYRAIKCQLSTDFEKIPAFSFYNRYPSVVDNFAVTDFNLISFIRFGSY